MGMQYPAHATVAHLLINKDARTQWWAPSCDAAHHSGGHRICYPVEFKIRNVRAPSWALDGARRRTAIAAVGGSREPQDQYPTRRRLYPSESLAVAVKG